MQRGNAIKPVMRFFRSSVLTKESYLASKTSTRSASSPEETSIQRAALGQSQGLVISLPESSTGWLAILPLLCSQARENVQEELLKRNK